MRRRWVGGWLFLFDRRNEKLAAVLSFATMIAVGFLMPPARRRVVDGEEIAELVFWGWVAPKWMVTVFIGALLLGSYWAYLKLLDKVWPERALKHITPAPLEGIDYLAPLFSPETTAREYLTSVAPSPMRIEAGGTPIESEAEFWELREEWIRTAPEATLRELLAVGEELLRHHPGDFRVIRALNDAMNIRGIPAREELWKLSDRLLDPVLVKVLLEPWSPPKGWPWC